MRYILYINLIFLYGILFAQNVNLNDSAVNYKYRKYEKFDLGNISIKGSVLTPGDVSIRDRVPSSITHDVYERENFNDHMDTSIQDIR